MDELTSKLSKTITAPAWKKIGIHHHHGIFVPLSSLHSYNSCGIGEFFDLIPMIDWCKSLNMDLIQLLPLNNSETDPSPYNTYSSCAINFIYLSLHALPNLENHPELEKKVRDLHLLNTTQHIIYEEVFTQKTAWLKDYFEVEGKTILASSEFKRYLQENPWVEEYAQMRALPNKENPTFYELLEYLCYVQLKKVKEYANRQGVYLLGDLPILMGKESIDVRKHPTLFILDVEAGAPPDYYNKKGQNWGFPIFNWEEMRKTQCHWWKQRLAYAENFFDLFRLDHVMGFFRIWVIPPGKPSKEGKYLPAEEKEWGPQGKELLHMISTSTTMLPIAEDLGTVPDIVRPTLCEMGICGTKVMRWERNWNKDNAYIPIQDYPPISLTTVSTHDSETLTLWWKNFKEEAKPFADSKGWTYTPDLSPSQRQQILWDSHHTASLLHINLLQEYLAFFPDLIWGHMDDERINIPGTLLPTNWTYRFRPSVEEIISNKNLFTKMQSILLSEPSN